MSDPTAGQPPAQARPRPGPGSAGGPATRTVTAVPANVVGGTAASSARMVTSAAQPGGARSVAAWATPGSQLARRPLPGPGVLRAAPNVARVAAGSVWQLASWSLGATIASADFVTKRALEGQSPTAIMQDAAHELRHAAWRALGLDERAAAELAGDEAAAGGRTGGETPAELQRRGTDLLRRSNDVHVVEDAHPAFSRILTEITPDEARILRYLYLEGPQPAVDVRTFRPFGIGSVLIASGLNMIAEYAGCRNPDRSEPYLTNLSRLGLIDFSKEPVTNPGRYQVIEAQPKVLDALKRAGRLPKTVHRSVALTTFGEEFVRTCLPLNGRVVPYRNRVLEAGEIKPEE